IPSKVQVLTGVGLEHTRWLGPTIADIATEKLAIVRDHATLVIPEDLHPDARAVAEKVAAERHARLVVAPSVVVGGGSVDVPIRLRTATRDIHGPAASSAAPSFDMAARGAFQRRNFALACA